MKKLLWLVIGLVLYGGFAAAQTKQEAKPQDGSGSVKINVVKSTNGKPVRNASVILHSLNKEGTQGSGGINLKTDSDGKTSFDGVPFGTLRVQVIARGYQTYGEDFEITKPEQEITIKLNPPADQFSIYNGTEKKQ